MFKPDNLERARILIVDDCPDSASLLVELLALENFHAVHSTTDAAVVCDLHAVHNYDLILLDMHMPYISGLTVMAQLRKLSPDTFLPVIALTGNDELRLHALEVGAYDFITKPYDIAEMAARVRNMLEVRLLYKFVDEQRRLAQNTGLHDPLTGLPNRRLAMDRISAALEHAKRRQTMTAVMYLGLDGLGLVADRRGHGYADQLLKDLAVELPRRIRQEDTVARIGDDEFLIVLREIRGQEGTLRPAQEIFKLFVDAMPTQEAAAELTTGIGIAVWPLDAADPETLLLRADEALHEARLAGTNQYRFARPLPLCAAQP